VSDLAPPLVLSTVALAAVGVAIAGLAAWRAIDRARCERLVASRIPPGPTGIIPGAEPFTLHPPERHLARAQDERRAALVLHGFGDTPQSVRYLAEYLHARGWTVRVPLHPGHGRTLAAFAASRADEWLAHARGELDALAADHECLSIVGVSMGGALATVLAAERPSLSALALVAPYLGMSPALHALVRCHWAWGPLVAYVDGRSGARSILDPEERARTLGYGYCTPRLLRELAGLVDRARRAAPLVRAPTLMVHSREDHRVSAAIAERAFARYGAAERRLMWTSGNGHVITVDYGREAVFAAVAAWLETHRRPAPGAPTPPADAPSGAGTAAAGR
jgi:carboxylesterase